MKRKKKVKNRIDLMYYLVQEKKKIEKKKIYLSLFLRLI